MRDVFIADAHLLDPGDENYRRLLCFLEELRGNTRTLFLLGDIFEFWIGYRQVVFAPYVPLLESLRRLRESGTRLLYVEGNHDFHMGPYFEKVLGCRVLPDGGEVELDGRRVHLAHGDLVHPRDYGYKLLRRVLRCRPARSLMALVPPDWAWDIAHWASRQSQKTHAAKKRDWDSQGMLAEHARRRFAEGFAAVVTGHFHVPLLREMEGRTLLALGDWIDQFSYAVFEDGKFSLQTY